MITRRGFVNAIGPAVAALASTRLLPAELAVARSAAVWELGRAAARQGRFVSADDLAPLYARPPEAVTLWESRHRARA